MYENDEIEIDLSRVFEIIKKHFKPFALIILAASIVAVLITLFLIPKKYTAEAKLIIVQKSNQDSQQISYNDLQTSQKLVNTYSEILKSEAISDEVIQNLKLEDLDTDESSILEHKNYAETLKASRDNIAICKKSTRYGINFVMLGMESHAGFSQ